LALFFAISLLSSFNFSRRFHIVLRSVKSDFTSSVISFTDSILEVESNVGLILRYFPPFLFQLFSKVPHRAFASEKRPQTCDSPQPGGFAQVHFLVNWVKVLYNIDGQATGLYPNARCIRYGLWAIAQRGYCLPPSLPVSPFFFHSNLLTTSLSVKQSQGVHMTNHLVKVPLFLV
jgi:hypothetical protein